MINTSRLLNLFFDLVRIDSPSRAEKPVAEFLCALLTPRGYAIRRDNAGDAIHGNTGNLLVRVPATGPGEPLAFSAHMDCVPPCHGVEPILRDGVIRSVGDTVLGGDDKAGIAAILEALFHLEESDTPHPEFLLVFTISEEEGLLGAQQLDFSSLGVSQAVVLDASGPVGTIITRSPAKSDIHVTFHGRAAHAGMEPEKGISAIQMAADAISRMRLLRIDEDTVANLGRIEGGSKTNIVAGEVTLTGEARAHDAEKLAEQLAHMRRCCEDAAKQHGGSIDFVVTQAYPALVIAPDAPLVQRTATACTALGLAPRITGTGGGSDANIFAGRGIACVNLGIGMSRVHTVDEFISVESLEQTARLTAALMQG